MKCPVDNATLAMSVRDGVEIDYCPECRGVWLDRSELDKIIERSMGNTREVDSDRASNYQDDRYDRGRRNDRNDNDDDEGGFLGNIFGGFGRGGDD